MVLPHHVLIHIRSLLSPVVPDKLINNALPLPVQSFLPYRACIALQFPFDNILLHLQPVRFHLLHFPEKFSKNNIKCENNHTQLKVIDEKTNQQITEFNINGRDFHITACLNKNSNSYFKYILLFLKTNNDTYSIYERIPVFYNFYNSFNDEYDESDIIINAQNTRLTVKDALNDNTSLIFNYMLYRKGTYLLNFAINHDNEIEYIFRDTSENKYIITPLNMSLKLYKDMVEKYCQDNTDACKAMQIEKTLPVSSEFNN